jgi:hypothetical protein
MSRILTDASTGKILTHDEIVERETTGTITFPFGGRQSKSKFYLYCPRCGQSYDIYPDEVTKAVNDWFYHHNDDARSKERQNHDPEKCYFGCCV